MVTWFIPDLYNKVHIESSHHCLLTTLTLTYGKLLLLPSRFLLVFVLGSTIKYKYISLFYFSYTKENTYTYYIAFFNLTIYPGGLPYQSIAFHSFLQQIVLCCVGI